MGPIEFETVQSLKRASLRFCFAALLLSVVTHSSLLSALADNDSAGTEAIAGEQASESESEDTWPAESVDSATAPQAPVPSDTSVPYDTSRPLPTLDEINARASTSMISESEHTVLSKILFYLPNRIIDLLDIFHVDVGVGGAVGAVGRVTRYGQFGCRGISPASFRIGIVGRSFPYFEERTTECGLGAKFSQSYERFVTPFEVGVGADLGLGAYVGLSFDELLDFVGGIVLIDFKDDDLGY